MNFTSCACSSMIVRIWSSWAEPVPPIFIVPFFSLTAARYSFAVLYGVSAFTQRMNWSRARRATGVRSFHENGTPVCSGVVKRFDSVMMMVWASPFLPFTCRNPSAPAPPDLLTTMIGRGESLCFSAMPWITRAIWSAPPPVPAGTTNSIGLVGSQATAETGTTINSVKTSATTTASSFIARSFARSQASGLCRMEYASNTYTTRKGRVPFHGSPALPAKSAEEEPRAILALLRRQRRLRRVQTPERYHRRNLPLLPHLVDLRLEVVEILLDEVREPPLLQEILAHRLAGAPLDDRLGLAVVLHVPVFDFVEREDPGLDGQLAELVRQHRVVVPTLRARIERMDER